MTSFTGRWARARGAQWAVREAEWKLIANVRDTSNPDAMQQVIPFFLANLTEDTGERRNAADANPRIVERLKKLHDALK